MLRAENSAIIGSGGFRPTTVDEICAPDTIMPCQMETRDSRDNPERHLMRAIFQSAMDDLRYSYAHPNSAKLRACRADALAWIQGAQAPVPFALVCETLGEDEGRLGARILRMCHRAETGIEPFPRGSNMPKVRELPIRDYAGAHEQHLKYARAHWHVHGKQRRAEMGR